LVIRGFAMINGVSFTDGKHRVTGRILPDGRWELQPGGRWYWRFSPVQRWAILVVVGLELLSYTKWGSTVANLLGVMEILIMIVFVGRLSKVHRQFHGAEHMVANVLEGREAAILHPGCGSNLILLLLPGALVLFLPWPLHILLVLEAVYAGIVFKWLWPRLYRGLKTGDKWAHRWWKVSQRWQRLFVAEPQPEQVQLADAVLKHLLQMRSGGAEKKC